MTSEPEGSFRRVSKERATARRPSFDCQVKAAEKRPAMHPQTAFQPRSRLVAHVQPQDARRIAMTRVGAGFTGVEMAKTRRVRFFYVVGIEIALRPAQMIRYASKVLDERRPCLEQIVAQARAFRDWIGAHTVPARMRMCVAVKLEGPGLTFDWPRHI